jgi:hypothetical protein
MTKFYISSESSNHHLRNVMDLNICCSVGCKLGKIPLSSAGAEGRRKRWGGLGWAVVGWHSSGEKAKRWEGERRGGNGWSGSAGRFWPRGLVGVCETTTLVSELT